MVSKSKSSTPTVADSSHPANSLSFGNDDQISALSKLHPTLLANQQDEYNTDTLNDLRASYKYLYVVNWLYHFRGYIKLQLDLFDVDLFELELLNYFPLTPNHLLNFDPEASSNAASSSMLFINRLKLALISTLQNSKLSSLNNFEKIFRLWFGTDTPLGGTEDLDDEQNENTENGPTKPTAEDDIEFDTLSISDKFEVLYILISYISSYSKFRDWVDKWGLSAENLRVNSLIADPHNTDSYYLLFDSNRLYKRVVLYPQLVIPKKRKSAPEYPEGHFKPTQFDISKNIKFELLYKNIYEFDEFLKRLKKSVKLKALVNRLHQNDVVDAIFASEIKKRKFLVNKRKEVQLATLLATRKRSSRLEAKEKQRQEELEKQREQEEYELKLAAEKRLERRRIFKEQQQRLINEGQRTDFGFGLTREDRIKLRRLDKTPTFTPTPNPAEASETADSVEYETVKSEVEQEFSETANETAALAATEATKATTEDSIEATSEVAVAQAGPVKEEVREVTGVTPEDKNEANALET